MTLQITLGAAPVQDALEEAGNLTRLGYPAPPDFARANALLNPLGEQPARGWFLLLRQDLNKLNLNGLLTLLMADDYGNSVPVPNLVVSREPTCLTPSMTDNDPLACYLVEVADARWRCHNPYYSIPLNAQYNVRAPGWGGQYYADTLNAGTPWTWTAMLQNIWNAMAAQLGAWPGLPSGVNPDGVPERYRFLGVSAWRALCQVLDKLGMAVAWNTAKGNYTIVAIGASDNATQRLLNAAAGRLIHDNAYLTVVRGRVPAGVVVYFHRWQDRGTEATTEQDGSQFVTNAAYSVQVAAPSGTATDAEPGVYHPLWDDLPAVYNASGTLTNAAALAARAQTRANAYYNQIQGNGGGRLNQTYTGIVAVNPGATIRGVVWRQDRQGGLVTEIVRTPWTPLRAGERGQFEPALNDGSALRPSDYRVREPMYPDLLQTVRVTSTTASNGLYPAVVEHFNTATNAWTDAETCNVLDANGNTLALQRYSARLIGSVSAVPLYAAVSASGGSSALTLWDKNGSVIDAACTVLKADPNGYQTWTHLAGGEDQLVINANGIVTGPIVFPGNTTWNIGGYGWTINNGWLLLNVPMEVCASQLWCCATLQGLNPPTAPTLSVMAGSQPSSITAYVKITYVGTNQESQASAEASIAVSSAQQFVVASPAAESGATGYNVYASSATGTETLQNAAPIAIGTNWTEPMTGLTTTGASPPTTNVMNNVAAFGKTVIDVTPANGTGGTTITGIVPASFNGASGPQFVVVRNVGSEPLVIDSLSTQSAASNDVLLPPAFGSSVSLGYGDAIGLWWDACTLSDWAVLFCTVDLEPPPPAEIDLKCSTYTAPSASVNDAALLPSPG